MINVKVNKKFNLQRKTSEIITYLPGEQLMPQADAEHSYSKYFIEVLEEVKEEIKIKKPGRPKKEEL